MPRPTRFDFTMAAADRDGVCLAQTTAGAADLVIAGALATGGVATMDVPRHVSIYSAANLSAIGFTVTGTDRLGNTITEAITGPNATTVKGGKNFKTVTQVAADGAVGSNVEVGSADEAETQWVPMNRYSAHWTVSVGLSSGASLTYALQSTCDDVWATGFLEDDPTPVVDVTMTAETTSTEVDDERPLAALRIAVTSFASGTASISIMQADR